MPQLQEGDEIVHINGRTVKELPHQEVFFSLELVSRISIFFILSLSFLPFFPSFRQSTAELVIGTSKVRLLVRSTGILFRVSSTHRTNK